MTARLKAAGLLPLAIAATVALAILLGLGTWQLNRRTWKEQILSTMAERAGLKPVTNAAWPSLRCPGPEPQPVEKDPCDFRPVRLTLTPASPDERHIFIAVPRQPNGIGGPGYWVFQRHRLAPPAMGEVYLNRGFVPEARKLLTTRPGSAATGVVEVTGLLRRAEPRSAYSNPNDIGKNIYYVRAPLELGVAEPVPAPPGPSPRYYYVDQTGPVPSGHLPYPMAGKIEIPNRHLEYALTWYGLAATLLVIVAVFARQRLQRSAPSA